MRRHWRAALFGGIFGAVWSLAGSLLHVPFAWTIGSVAVASVLTSFFLPREW